MKKLLSSFLLALPLMANPTTGTTLSNITLDKSSGGYIQGGAWSSDMLEGKTTLLLYVDPDEQSIGESFNATLDALEKELQGKNFQILLVLNLNATWKPNAIIEALVKKKMQEYPHRIYVVDKKSILVKKWHLNDDAYNMLLLDSSAKVLYAHTGAWSKESISEVDTLVRQSVANAKES